MTERELPRASRIVIEPIRTEQDYDEWIALFANRNEMAEEYAVLMSANGMKWEGYKLINEAILRRWSMAGLRYIKERAWKALAA